MHVKKGFVNEKRFQMLFVNNLIQLVIGKSFHTVMPFYRYNQDIKEMRSIHKNSLDTISLLPVLNSIFPTHMRSFTCTAYSLHF